MAATPGLLGTRRTQTIFLCVVLGVVVRVLRGNSQVPPEQVLQHLDSVAKFLMCNEEEVGIATKDVDGAFQALKAHPGILPVFAISHGVLEIQWRKQRSGVNHAGHAVMKRVVAWHFNPAVEVRVSARRNPKAPRPSATMPRFRQKACKRLAKARDVQRLRRTIVNVGALVHPLVVRRMENGALCRENERLVADAAWPALGEAIDGRWLRTPVARVRGHAAMAVAARGHSHGKRSPPTLGNMNMNKPQSRRVIVKLLHKGPRLSLERLVRNTANASIKVCNNLRNLGASAGNALGYFGWRLCSCRTDGDDCEQPGRRTSHACDANSSDAEYSCPPSLLPHVLRPTGCG
eukprot:m.189349 g.189349  ORF g.189349 m.189349 type:complete len:348 (-) comp10565_c0_seq1:86-1129(-)